MKKFFLVLSIIVSVVVPTFSVNAATNTNNLLGRSRPNTLPEGCQREGIVDSMFSNDMFLDAIYKSVGYNSIFVPGSNSQLGPYEKRTDLEGITVSDVLNLKNIEVRNASSVKGMSCFINLENYGGYRTVTNNYKYFSELKKLKTIRVSYSVDENVDGLKNVTSLEKFEAFFSNLKNVDGLKNNKKMKKIVVNYSALSDISGLSEMTELVDLNFYSTSVRDISSLQNLPNLERILLVRTAVEDLSPLVNSQFLGEKTTIYLSGSYENSRLVGEVLEKYLDDIETLRSRGITVSAPF